ncbi:MAG: hypothetical protein ACI92O_001502 [Colwellia sp.]|jgi:hypothetical protein
MTTLGIIKLIPNVISLAIFDIKVISFNSLALITCLSRLYWSFILITDIRSTKTVNEFKHRR